jgi:hypothetical protein
MLNRRKDLSSHSDERFGCRRRHLIFNQIRSERKRGECIHSRVMETIERKSFETDLDDDDGSTGRTESCWRQRRKRSSVRTDWDDEQGLPPLSFDKRLVAHHSNRLHQTFGQRNLPSPTSNDETLLNLSYKTPFTTTGNLFFLHETITCPLS